MAKFVFLFLVILIFWTDTFANERLLVGETFEVSGPGVLTIEDGRVLRAKKQGSRYTIQAIAPGQSTYQLGERSGLIEVQSASFQKTSQVLANLVKRSLSFHLNSHGGQLDVTGRLTRFRDWQILAEGCAHFLCHYRAAFEIPAQIFDQVRRRIADDFSAHEFGAVDLLEKTPLQILAPADSPSIKEFASRYGLGLLIEKSSLTLQPSIKVQLVIAEVKKSETQKLGIDWPAQYQAQVLPRVTIGGDPLLVSAQFLENRGIGHVLASPNLLCRSGKEAEFLAGGELPIKIINIKMQDVVWKKYGILLKIQPLADWHGHMSIGLTSEISSVDPAHSVDGIPGFFSNRVQSHFDLREPRTIALSGLIKSEESTATNGLPFLSRIPILGKLFGSEDFRKSRTELVIFVRPEVLSSKNGEDI